MTTTEVANKLVELCRTGQNLEAINSLYSADVVSVEASGPPEMLEMKGRDAVVGKAQWWIGNHEIHSANVEGPLVAGNHFAVTFKYDITNKPSGKRMMMEEVASYKVDGGKIVREQFFY